MDGDYRHDEVTSRDFFIHRRSLSRGERRNCHIYKLSLLWSSFYYFLNIVTDSLKTFMDSHV